MTRPTEGVSMGSSADGTPVDLRAFTVVGYAEYAAFNALTGEVLMLPWQPLSLQFVDDCPPPFVVEARPG